MYPGDMSCACLRAVWKQFLAGPSPLHDVPLLMMSRQALASTCRKSPKGFLELFTLYAIAAFAVLVAFHLVLLEMPELEQLFVSVPFLHIYFADVLPSQFFPGLLPDLRAYQG